MQLLHNIYSALPYQLQNVLISAYGYFWKGRRLGGIFSEELLKATEREKFSEEEWTNYKQQHFSAIVNHAYNTVPFYKSKISALNLSTEFIKNISLADIAKLPLLEKDEFRKYGTTTLLSEKRETKGKYFSSSGSSGTPTRVLFSHQMHQRWSAIFVARAKCWAGVDNTTPRGMIGGRRVVAGGNAKPPYYRYNYFEKQVYFSAYHLSPHTVNDYIEGMKKYSIEYMTGYAVSNYLLALYIKQRGLAAPPMKAVITSSEKLTDEMRLVLEEVYKCKAFDTWSGVEACALVTECESGNLHISEDAGLIEILDENGNEVNPGETGEVVCTGLLNYDQPLIRYRIGDRMTKSTLTSCPCGRKMPMIKEIDGRLEDIITGPDGRQMVRFHSVFYGFEKIERAQVIQHTIHEIEVKIQNEVTLTTEETCLLKDRMLSQLGDVNITINQHQKIERTANGKFKAVISHVKI